MALIDAVKDCIQDLRDNIWDDLLDKVSIFCDRMYITVPDMEDKIPVWCFCEGQWIICYHHYQVEVIIAVIDIIATEMYNRSVETNTELLTCISCLDPRDSFSIFDPSRLLRIAKIYYDDFSV